MIKNKHVLKMLKFLRRDQNFEKKKGPMSQTWGDGGIHHYLSPYIKCHKHTTKNRQSCIKEFCISSISSFVKANKET